VGPGRERIRTPEGGKGQTINTKGKRGREFGGKRDGGCRSTMPKGAQGV